MRRNPCYQCEERELGCHCECTAWKTYETLRNEDYERRQKIKAIDYYEADRIERVRRATDAYKRHSKQYR